MTRQERTWAVAGFGVLTALVLAVGVDTLGGILALVQLGFLVGAPTALLLGDALRSRAAVGVVAGTLSLAITAMAVQSLVWFDLAAGPLIVLTATAYGTAIAVLLDSAEAPPPGQHRPEGADTW